MRFKLVFLFITLIPIFFYLGKDDVDANEISNKLINCVDNNTDSNTDNYIRCARNLMKTSLSIKNIKDIVDTISNENKDNIKFNNLCHDIAHIIGEEAYVQHKDRALIKNLQSCGEGFIHGVMGKYQSSGNGVLKLIEYCEDIPSNTDLNFANDFSLNLYFSCYHGLGHSHGAGYIIDDENVDFIKRDFISNNYKFCQNIFNIVENKYNKSNGDIISYCFYGGYSEFIVNYYQYKENNNKSYNPFVSNNDFIDCNIIPNSKTLIYCYQITTIISLNIIKKNFINLPEPAKARSNDKLVTNVNNFCRLFSSKDYSKGCLEGLSSYYIKELFSNKYSLDNLVNDPKNINIYLKNACSFDIEDRCRDTFLIDLKAKVDKSFYNELISILET